jgi:hypothetical protein
VLRNDAEALAIYTQWDWKVTPRLTATLGARWNDEDKEIRYTPNASPRITTAAANRIFDSDDFQLPSAFTTATGAIQFLTRNFAALRNRGVELELVASPLDGLDVFATVGLQDAEYRDLDPSSTAQLASCRGARAGSSGCRPADADAERDLHELRQRDRGPHRVRRAAVLSGLAHLVADRAGGLLSRRPS